MNLTSPMRWFPYGRAALTMLILALASGLWLGAQPASRRESNLSLWVFAKTHYEAYLKAAHTFEAKHPGVHINVQLVANASLAARLQAAFLANVDVPDLVEIEISQAGSFFRGPLEDVGFADLTERVKQSGMWEKMVQSRFAPYTSRGRIFGLPHDVHPVMLAYRRDIFEQEGIDADQIKTWDDFIAVGKKLTIPNKRYLIELADTSSTNLETFLFQRGGGYFDAQGKCIFDNEIGVETMRFYVPLVAGKDKIGNKLGEGQIITRAVEEGYLLCLIAPDWRSKSFETDIPRMAGKMALMPLPAVREGERRTSTWGGTMLGITKRCRDQNLAWEFAQHLYLDKPELAERFRASNILPAMRDAWLEPSYREIRSYWSGQRLGKLYVDLAPDVPSQYTSPFVVVAKAKLGEALTDCVQRYNAQGKRGFDAFVRARLTQSADEVRRLIARNPY
jgi:arabinosaccharide transport system substrate-binding protein